MRVRFPLLMLLASLSCSGCALVHQAATVIEARTFGAIEDCTERLRNHKWAQEAWRDFQARVGTPLSDDYAEGFKEGFVDYLYQGGTGEPPPLPPRRYRKLRYQTPAGYRAIEDWFIGYRQGAIVACDGGYRRWVTGPSSLSPVDVRPPLVAGPQPQPDMPIVEQPITRIPIRVVPQQRVQDLPSPRKLVPEVRQLPEEMP